MGPSRVPLFEDEDDVREAFAGAGMVMLFGALLAGNWTGALSGEAALSIFVAMRFSKDVQFFHDCFTEDFMSVWNSESMAVEIEEVREGESLIPGGEEEGAIAEEVDFIVEEILRDGGKDFGGCRDDDNEDDEQVNGEESGDGSVTEEAGRQTIG